MQPYGNPKPRPNPNPHPNFWRRSHPLSRSVSSASRSPSKLACIAGLDLVGVRVRAKVRVRIRVRVRVRVRVRIKANP